MLPFAIPYPPELNEGYWGLGTATIDWCEENYVVSHYVAEAINTITNSLFIVLAAYAMYQSRKQQHEWRFTGIAFGFMLVGVGSWLFHMTLLYQYQLLDELPMIYATCIPFWLVFSEDMTARRSSSVAMAIFMGAALLTAIYLHYRDPTIHQVAYALLNVAIMVRSVSLTRRIADPAAKKQMLTTMTMGVMLFLTGYVLWNLDIHLCDFWRLTRRSWGMPYGFVLEGHGWWHLFTGIGVYYYVVYLECLRAHLLGRGAMYEFKWRRGVFPDLLLKKKPKTV